MKPLRNAHGVDSINSFGCCYNLMRLYLYLSIYLYIYIYMNKKKREKERERERKNVLCLEGSQPLV